MATQVTLNDGSIDSAGSLALKTNGTTTAVTINTSQNVGIGTSSPVGRLGVVVSGTGDQNILSLGTTGAGGQGLLLGVNTTNSVTTIKNNTGAYGMAFYSGTGASESMRIDSSGNLLVGTTNASQSAGIGIKMIANATGQFFASVTDQTTNGGHTNYHLYSTGAGAYRFYVGAGGTIFATSTTISSLSDVRHKENIRDLDVGLAEIMQLQPRVFDWKEGKGKNIQNDRGFIAQEVEQVFPDLIDEWKDPAPEGEDPYKSVRQDLIPVLVKAIQEMKAIIDTQASTIIQLQADVAALKGTA